MLLLADFLRNYKNRTLSTPEHTRLSRRKVLRNNFDCEKCEVLLQINVYNFIKRIRAHKSCLKMFLYASSTVIRSLWMNRIRTCFAHLCVSAHFSLSNFLPLSMPIFYLLFSAWAHKLMNKMHFQAITIFHIVCFMIRAEKAKIEQQMSGKEREREKFVEL